MPAKQFNKRIYNRKFRYIGVDSPGPLTPGRNWEKGGVKKRALAIGIWLTLGNAVENKKVKAALRFTKGD